MREGRDVGMPEGGNSMSDGSRLAVLVSFVGMFERLARMLVPAQVILLSVLPGHTVGVGGAVVQFGGSLVVLVVRSVVVTSGHL